jgi:hypothetical protein
LPSVTASMLIIVPFTHCQAISLNASGLSSYSGRVDVWKVFPVMKSVALEQSGGCEIA